MNISLIEQGFKQRSQLTTTQKFPLEDNSSTVARKFSLSDIVANTNKMVGRTVRKCFQPQPRKFSPDDKLYSVLIAAGLIPSLTQSTNTANDKKSSNDKKSNGNSSAGNKSSKQG